MGQTVEISCYMLQIYQNRALEDGIVLGDNPSLFVGALCVGTPTASKKWREPCSFIQCCCLSERGLDDPTSTLFEAYWGPTSPLLCLTVLCVLQTSPISTNSIYEHWVGSQPLADQPTQGWYNQQWVHPTPKVIACCVLQIWNAKRCLCLVQHSFSTELQRLHKENESVCRGMCSTQENTNLSFLCRWGPVRCWCPWRSLGWRFPWWPLSLWAYSSERPGLLASWHVWSPCSGPRPGSVRRTNNRLDLTLGKQLNAEPGWNEIWKLEEHSQSQWSRLNIISKGQFIRLAVQKKVSTFDCVFASFRGVFLLSQNN